ncbi:MAG TPA: hypothetical protein VGD65_17340 [Chryseosolibacter sp.]
MKSIGEIVAQLQALNNAAKLDFYDRLGSHLTISIRSVWSDTSYGDKEKLERIKIINELMHQVFNWTWRLRHHDNTFDDADAFRQIGSYARADKIVGGEIGAALSQSCRLLKLE